jgi:protein-S-isoprenylcysteine O-methyltransferase Ste14
MAVPESVSNSTMNTAVSTIGMKAYRVFAYFGLMSIFAAFLLGFRYDPEAPQVNYAIDLLLYVAFVVPHLVLTRGWFKEAVWGDPAGSPRERRVYISLTLVTWLGLLALHLPVPGPHWSWSPDLHVAGALVQFVGCVGFLWCLLMFFQGATPEGLDGLLGVPGSVTKYSHGPETPLFSDGPYALVRHPMYRAVILAGLCALLVHPNAGQLLWSALIGATFIGFIPIEEAQLLSARGDDYRRYQEQTPYRLFRGIW